MMYATFKFNIKSYFTTTVDMTKLQSTLDINAVQMEQSVTVVIIIIIIIL